MANSKPSISTDRRLQISKAIRLIMNSQIGDFTKSKLSSNDFALNRNRGRIVLDEIDLDALSQPFALQLMNIEIDREDWGFGIFGKLKFMVFNKESQLGNCEIFDNDYKTIESAISRLMLEFARIRLTSFFQTQLMQISLEDMAEILCCFLGFELFLANAKLSLRDTRVFDIEFSDFPKLTKSEIGYVVACCSIYKQVSYSKKDLGKELFSIYSHYKDGEKEIIEQSLQLD